MQSADDVACVLERYPGYELNATQQAAAWQAVCREVLSSDVPFAEHWHWFQEIHANRPASWGPAPAWYPRNDSRSNLETTIAAEGFLDFSDYHDWTRRNRGAFWQDTIARLEIPFQTAPKRIVDGTSPEHTTWLTGAKLNIAEACFLAPGDQTAIVEADEQGGKRHWTYDDLWQHACGVANGLLNMGLQKGDGVALYMPMTMECVALYLGTVMAGLHVVSVPDSFVPEEVNTRLRLGDAKVMATVSAFTRGQKAVDMLAKARQTSAECLIVVGDTTLQTNELGWSEFLGGTNFDAEPMQPTDLSNILFSSGTTGEPKAIGWTHTTPLKAAMDGHYHQDIHSDDVVAWPTNIGWMMGPWLIYATFVNRATMALFVGSPAAPEFLSFMRKQQVSVLGVVPAIVRSWQDLGVATGSLPDVRIFSSTGEASSASDYLYLMSLADYRAPVIEYCGGTEIGGAHITGSVLQPQSPATFSTPAMGLDFILLDADAHPVTEGIGELFLIPPSIGLSESLLNRDHHDEYFADCPAGPHGEVLRRHGDEMEALPGGFWSAQGRADDTMNLGGMKVASIELERVMNQHEQVQECAAVAVRPAGGGADRLVVFVVPRQASNDSLHAELQQLIRSQLNPLYRIHDVVCVPTLPRTASNKVMRRALRSQYA